MCLLLALLSAVWISRDLVVARHPSDVWWLWAGVPLRPEGAAVWATTLLEPVLGIGCLAAVVAVLRRSPSAPCALSAVAGVTLLFRAPPLWNLGADGLPGAGAGARGWALITAGVALVVSVLLLIAASAGRGGADRRESRLRRAPAVVAALLLAGAGVILAAWQAYTVRELGWSTYWGSVVGDGDAHRVLLQPPGNWTLLSLALLSLVSAVGAARRAPSLRPLGLLTAALLLAHGAAALAAEQRAGLLGHFRALAPRTQLDVATAAFTVLAGLVALLALARPAAGAAVPRGPVGEPLPPGYAPPPPPADLPPNW
ncbi:hypothetical protein [Streptomyces paromomycinus]|uniref:hypothetical protein n=1 Tax=Streptomyces paromomycinus TaxID=92743 RepID=UPI000F61F5BB|nr:hypothetical protein [Streptomyces paromomycinus]